MKPSSLRDFIRRTRTIEGWFSRDEAALFALIDEAQRSQGISGDLFEIGVHHGKSTLMLVQMAGDIEAVRVCDVFGSPDANVSGSGSGDRAIFEGNLASMGVDARVLVFEKLSLELNPAEIGGPYRFFHVDGGHLESEALADLRLAAEVLHPQGAIAVDDPFRPEWPGVTEALLRFCAERADFEPLVMGFNKLILVPAATRPAYEDYLLANAWAYVSDRVYARKVLPIAGTDTQIYFVPAGRQLPSLVPWIARARYIVRRSWRRVG